MPARQNFAPAGPRPVHNVLHHFVRQMMVFTHPGYLISQRGPEYPWIIACDDERSVAGNKLFHRMMLGDG